MAMGSADGLRVQISAGQGPSAIACLESQFCSDPAPAGQRGGLRCEGESTAEASSCFNVCKSITRDHAWLWIVC
jgi:hypothetical protein